MLLGDIGRVRNRGRIQTIDHVSYDRSQDYQFLLVVPPPKYPKLFVVRHREVLVIELHM